MTEVINNAPIKWAQRSDSLYLTIALPDVKDESIVLTDSELQFKGSSNGKVYQVHIEFLKGVDSKGSTYKVLPRNIQMHVQKAKEDSDGFWPRLLKDKTLEKNQVTVDWDRYVDEDEEQDKGGFDLSNLDGGNSMAGMGGMGGMDMEALMRNMGGMGGGMGGMGGGMGDMGGAGGMNFDDMDDGGFEEGKGDSDDDDELPDLEPA